MVSGQLQCFGLLRIDDLREFDDGNDLSSQFVICVGELSEKCLWIDVGPPIPSRARDMRLTVFQDGWQYLDFEAFFSKGDGELPS